MYLTKKLKKNRVAIYTIISFFIILESLSYTYIVYIKDNATELIEQQATTDFKTLTKIANNYLGDLSKVFYDTVIDTPDIEYLMYQATHSKKSEELKKLREVLYKNYKSTYDYMKESGVRQLHFHLPNAVSFLRFHRPEKFGDSLLGVRPSLEYVNKYREDVHVFEEGRIFNGFRNVYPIFYKKEFVGTVEISYSFKALQQKMADVITSSLLFLINSEIVQEKVFQSEQTNYTKCQFEDFLYDKQALQTNSEFSIEEMSFINAKIGENISTRLRNAEAFSIVFGDKKIADGHNILVSFLPVSNINNKQVAYIVHYKFDDISKLVVSKYKILFLSLTLFSFFLSLSIGLLLQRAKLKEEKEHSIATHDPLTKAYNRYGLDEIVEQKMHEFKRFKRDLSVIFFDIDHFKHVNDLHGHAAGDDVLVAIAKLTSLNIRDADIFARWGGEEFLVVLPETGLQSAVGLAEKLRVMIEIHKFDLPMDITCSFGVIQIEENESFMHALSRSDKLLYDAKAAGRNCTVSKAYS